MSPSSSATIYLVRHAQGHHNLPREEGGPNPHNIPDPALTDLGRQQCEALKAAFPAHEKLTHLVASPLRRTLYTCQLGFAPAVAAGKRVIAQPLVQECSTLPCDVGSDPEALAAEFDAASFDLGLVTPGWHYKGPESPNHPNMTNLDARARKARLWLRDLAARYAEGEAHIIVVTHGGFLHFLTEDWDGMASDAGTGWNNTEFRAYSFADPTGQDADAKLREKPDSWRRRRGSTVPLSEAEQRELRSVLKESLQEEFERVEQLRLARGKQEIAERDGVAPGSPPTVYIHPH